MYEDPLKKILNETHLRIAVADKKNNSSIPCRITIVNGSGILQMTGASTNEKLAVRPGYIYSLDGTATIGLPAGKYTVYAGRGFDYSDDSIQIVIKPGEHLQKSLFLEQEVNTKGFISCASRISAIHSRSSSGAACQAFLNLPRIKSRTIANRPKAARE